MARAAKVVQSASTELTNWDEELARQAEIAAGMEANTGGGQFFSVKGGILSFNDAALPGNEMAVVILDSILENVFYEGEYDPDNPTPPTCFAFGRDEAEIAPYPAVVERGQAQNEQCTGCPMNAWGTADKGRGKACRNTRRLALIPAGAFDAQGRFTPNDDKAHFATSAIGFMKLSVTSVKGYATFVKQVAGALRRPPSGIFTRIKVVPDAKTQFRILFEVLGEVPRELLTPIMKRRDEASATIEQPYSLDVEERPEPAARGRGGKAAANVRPPVKKAGAAVKGKKY
jgi:hypothetical protein